MNRAAIDIPGARHLHSGKVRDLYELGSGDLLMVASDRISAYDYVLDSEIPDKGKVLTAMSLWWFDQLSRLVPNHVVSLDVPAQVAGRAIVCEKLAMFEIECVARGYLTGSGLISYEQIGEVGGNELPTGLAEASELPEAIFTPSTKAPIGEHDEAVDYDHVVEQVGEDIANELRTLTMTIYERARTIADQRGLILADTKFEFGERPDGTIVLADEVLTPDSSRYWLLAAWEPGHRQPAFDKQIVRDWLVLESGWDRESGEPPPPLSQRVIEQTRDRYIDAYQRLTGLRFE